MDEYIVTINGTDYYYPKDYYEYLEVIGNSLINTGSTTITLYHDYPHYNQTNTGYPRIQISSNSRATIQTSQSATRTELVVSSFEYKTRPILNSVYVVPMLIILSILAFWRIISK